ncbi:DNA primase [Streptomyces sp. SAJ15]|nr:DNA primase [Streptomyces sp. SAJ15]
MGLLSAALEYAARGWHVFPLRPNDKRPAIKGWEQRATTDSARIERAWTAGPYGVGIACGPSRLVVVDLDTAKDDAPPEEWRLPGVVDGLDVLAELYARHADRFPFGSTPAVRTASGGMHLYHSAPEQEVRNSAGRVGWKVDVRAAGGYVVAPPSTAGGSPYQWETTAATAGPRPVPGWLLDLMLRTSAAPRPVVAASAPRGQRRAGDSLRGLVAFVLESHEGERNARLYWAACRARELVQAGQVDEGAVSGALVDAGRHVGLSETEATRTVRSAEQAPVRTGVSA